MVRVMERVMDKLTIDIIWWEDGYHRTNISMDFCGLIYHLYLNIAEEFMIEDLEIYDVLRQVLYFEVQDEDELIRREKFKPHNILNEEVMEVKYFNELDVLCDININ